MTPAAWDFVERSVAITDAAAGADAVVFGSLGARAKCSRSTIKAAAKAAQYAVCDVNLRPPFVEAAVVAEAARSADLLKVNDEELQAVALMLKDTAPDEDSAFAEEACAAAAAAVNAADEDDAALTIGRAAACLGAASGVSTVVVTRGSKGGVVWDASNPTSAWICGGFVAPAVADTVGAGDAFLAAFLASWLAESDASSALTAGCRLGAFVAGQQGATPIHDREIIAALRPCAGSASELLDLQLGA